MTFYNKIVLILFACFLTFGCASTSSSGFDSLSSDISSESLSSETRGSDTGKLEGLTSVNFFYDTGSIDSEARDKLNQNIKWLKEHPNVKLQIEGHCDARGSVEYNIALGERRAESVKRYLVSNGVRANQLATISYGKERLLVGGDDDLSHSKNRRVNFVILQ